MKEGTKMMSMPTSCKDCECNTCLFRCECKECRECEPGEHQNGCKGYRNPCETAYGLFLSIAKALKIDKLAELINRILGGK
ncbi:MAG: hypothetical protein IJU77_11425 [Butyrivibrio sp.]|nr:hypothetical protein [Butyrivibrio sp.]